MAENIKSLIEKIHQEGIKAAEEKAAAVEAQARQKAQEMIKEAQMEADKIIGEAKTQAKKIKESTQTLLKQAARDLLLSLRKQICLMLDKLTATKVREALSGQELIEIITTLIKNSQTKEITVSLNSQSLEKFEQSLLKELSQEVRNGITLQSEEKITGGFMISYDKGKSHYDFSDTALAEYIGTYLKPRLAEILKEIK
ncbi:hypothetical protein KKB84_08335 [bacterium]|nr:hypothetical protein [bacterium]MBU1153949.1 hypothetical protein [bacterium]